MTKHDDKTEAATGRPGDHEGDGSLGPGTTAGGGAVRAGERVDDATDEHRPEAPRDQGDREEPAS
jgi:hypothetical protein